MIAGQLMSWGETVLGKRAQCSFLFMEGDILL